MAGVLPGVNFQAVGSLSDDPNAGEPEIQKIIPLEDLLAIRRVFRESPLLEQIRGILQKSVWSAGMTFFRENLDKKGGKFSRNRHRTVYQPPSFVKETIESHLWTKFMHDVLDSLLMFGFVVVHYQTPKQANEEVVDERENQYPFPSVVPAELYRLMVSTSLSGGTKLVALHTRHQEPLPDTVVYCNYGYNPTCDGQLNSLVAKAYADIRFLQQHAATFMRIRGIRCYPTAVIESSVEVSDEKSGSMMAARRAYNLDLSETVGVNPADNLLARNVGEGQMAHSLMVDPNQVSEQDQLMYKRARKANALRRGDLKGAAMVDVDDNDGIEAPRRVGVAHGVPLRRGETVKFMPTPSETNDFHSTRHVVMENVAGVFGVPLAVLMGNAQSGHGRGVSGDSNSRVVHSMYRLTINTWRNKISDVLTKAFCECYWDLLLDDNTTSSKDNGNKLDVHTEKRRRMVYVDFHPTSFVDNHELRELYAWGILPWEAFSTYALSNASLPVEERNKDPPTHPLGIGLETQASAQQQGDSTSTESKNKKRQGAKGEKEDAKRDSKKAQSSKKRKAADSVGKSANNSKDQNIVITVKKD